MKLEVPSYDLDNWLNELKPYQRNTIQKLLEISNDPEEAAKKWITATGPQNTIPFGGIRDSKPFWDRFKEEIQKFFCDDSSYVTEKEVLLKEAPVSKSLLISVVSSAIGATIGYSATLLAPAIVIILYTIGKIGINAYCKGN